MTGYFCRSVYISRGIFGHFCAFLGKNSAFKLFYILSQASEHFIYLFLFYFLFFGGLGLAVRRKFIYFQANFEIFHVQLVVILHLYHG